MIFGVIDVLTIAGMLIYLLGGIVITIPGIVIFEKYHTPGKLLRGIETLEAEAITKEETGFEELREAINDIVKEQDQIGKDIQKLDIYSDGINVTGRVTNLKLVMQDEEDITEDSGLMIEEPTFERIRYQIYRKVRWGKTKIRTVGIGLILVGFTLQIYSSYYGLLPEELQIPFLLEKFV